MDEEFDLLDEQSSSTDNLDSEPVEGSNQEIEVYVMNDVYSGTISDTYLNYFSGIVSKLGFGEHYVVWKSNDYEFCMAYGSNLECNGYSFTGDDLWISKIWRESNNYNSTWYVSYSIDDISIDGTDKFIYSDLGATFPTLKKGVSENEIYSILFSISVLFIYIVVRDVFKHLSK